MITFNRNEAVYVVGRVAFLFSRPLFLLVANQFFGNGVAALIAAAFLVSAMLLTLLAVDSHRIYYARHFGTLGENAAFGFSRHVFSQAILSIVGVTLCIGYFGFMEGKWFAAAAAALFFVTEKLADEILRFTLFERARALWGWLMIRRLVPQFLMFGCIVLIAPASSAAGPLLILALAGGNLISFVPRVPGAAIYRLTKHTRSLLLHGSAALRLILGSGQLWALSLAAAFSSYNDRLIVLFAKKENLAIFTLLIVSLSMIQNAVEYFYLSQKRRDILEGKVNFLKVISSKSYIFIVLFSTLFGILTAFANIYFYKDAPDVPVVLFFFIAVSQISLATTLVAREVVYWNNQIKAALKVEVTYLSIITTSFLALSFLEMGYLWLLAAAASALIVRLVMFAKIVPERAPIKFS